MDTKFKIQTANSNFEKTITNSLLFETYGESFEGFDYEEVARLAPKFDTETFFSYSDKFAAVLSTATITYPTKEGLFPSEYYFGFNVPQHIRVTRVVELGKMAKRIHLTLPKGYEKLPYIALLLAIKEYSKQNNIEGWVASVHINLLNDIQKIGIPVQILADKVTIENEVTKAMGNYAKDVYFIYATMQDSFDALDKFKSLVDDGTISLDV